jgi:hypothetical protein
VYDAPVKRRLGVFAAALLPRLALATLTFGSTDLVASLRNTLRVMHGLSAVTPYLTGIELWLWISGHVVMATDLPLSLPYKFLPCLADALIALLLLESDAERGMRRALLYAFAPLPLFIHALHGQWDALWMIFLLLALLCARGSGDAAAVVTGAALVLSLVFKPVAIAVAPLLLPRDKRRAALFVVGAAVTAVLYAVIAWRAGMLVTLADLGDIANYAGGGVQLFGLPLRFPRLPALLAAAMALWALHWFRRIEREQAVLLFFCAAIGLAGLSPQYLCWPVAFALLTGRTRFLALYTLLAGIFLALYYELPAVNLRNVENLGTYGFLKPFGHWSPVVPDVRLRLVAQILGNYAVPLCALAYAIWSGSRPAAIAVSPPISLRPLVVPLALSAAFVVLADVWAANQNAFADEQFIVTVDRRVRSYDIVRYRAEHAGKMWVARSFVDPAAGRPILNAATLAMLWVCAWSVVAAREPS